MYNGIMSVHARSSVLVIQNVYSEISEVDSNKNICCIINLSTMDTI